MSVAGAEARSVHPFRAAVEARDLDAVLALFREDVLLTTPTRFRPYRGLEAARVVLGAINRLFGELRYEREMSDPGGREHAFVFRTSVGEREIHGCDFVYCDEDGRVQELCVMVRPLSAAISLAEAMSREVGGHQPG